MKKQLLLLLLTFVSASMYAYDACIDGICYEFSGTEATVCANSDDNGYYGYSGNITIPSKVSYNGITYSVTSIGECAFFGCSDLTSIDIPSSVTSIAFNAFFECTSLPVVDNIRYADTYLIGTTTNDLTTYTIKEGTRFIGSNAFQNCESLTSITIPSSVTSIGYSAFSGCSSLTSITISSSVTSIDDYAFFGCSGLTSITIPSSVTSISDYAFYGCSGLTSIDIPSSVTSIESCAFNGCSGLTYIKIPNSVTKIGNSAFPCTSNLTSLTTPAHWDKIDISPDEVETNYGYYFPETYGDDMSISVTLENCTDNYCGDGFPFSSFETHAIPLSLKTITVTSPIGQSMFKNWTNLETIVLSKDVTSIGSDAFLGCTNLKKIINYSPLTLQMGSEDNGNVAYYATQILNPSEDGNYLFCKNANDDSYYLTEYIGKEKSIILPTNYHGESYKIADNAFSNCTDLSSITIPSSVTDVSHSAFSGCSKITSITLAGELKANKIFADSKSSISEVRINDGSTTIVNGSFAEFSKLKAITIPSSVTCIGDSAFCKCAALTSVTMPSSVTSIGESAFSGCSGLISVTIPTSVTSIGSLAFSGCSSLTSITIPENVASIGDNAFKGCTNLTKLVYNAKNLEYESINSLFSTSLTDVTIGESVQKIPSYFLYGCKNLSTVTLPSGVTSIGDWAFSGCRNLPSIILPENVTSIGNCAFYNCSGLTSVILPENITSIGAAFCNCTSLTSIIIPANITSISASMFRGCDNLSSVTLPSSVTSIGEYAFADCSGLTSITLPSNITSISNYTFYNCGLTSITIPENVTSIGEHAFYGTGLTSIDIPSGVKSIGNHAFDCGNLTKLVYNAKNLNNCSDTPFSTALTEVVIGSSVQTIPSHFLYKCENVTSITLPSSVTTIGTYAFANCSGLTSITIPESVTNIYGYAFSGCSGLTSVTLPETVSSISTSAFTGCDNVQEVNIKLTDLSLSNKVVYTALNKYFADKAWTYYYGDEPLTSIPEGTKEIGDYVLAHYTNLTAITIPTSVNSIGTYAFRDCPNVQEVNIKVIPYKYDAGIALTNYVYNTLDRYFSDKIWTYYYEGEPLTSIPEGITKIGNYALAHYTNLTAITLPSSVKSIGNYAFADCGNLASITLPSSLTSIGYDAFEGCSSLTSITLPSSLTWIDSEAFSGCSSLTSIILPSNLTYIGSDAFGNCLLRGVRVKAQTPPTGGAAFSEQTYYQTTLYVPSGAKDAYAYSDNWYKFINIREESTTTSEVSGEVAYTLMNTVSNGYLIYDNVNNCVKEVASVASVDESNAYHNWMVVTANSSSSVNGKRNATSQTTYYVYNLGAKKYLNVTSTGYTLSDTPVAINMTNTSDGISFTDTNHDQWSFVKNEAMSTIEDVTPVENLKETSINHNGKFLENGRVIIRKDGNIFNAAGQHISK